MQPEAAALAANIYCQLLNSEGSAAHSIFNPMVFRSVIKVLSYWTDKNADSAATGSKRKAISPAGAEGKVKRKRKPGQGSSRASRLQFFPVPTSLPPPPYLTPPLSLSLSLSARRRGRSFLLAPPQFSHSVARRRQMISAVMAARSPPHRPTSWCR